jgi:hypothetical protein
MKKVRSLIIFILLVTACQFSFAKTPIEFRAEKQAMSTPMSPIEDMLFGYYYYVRPININFDGSLLNMYFDNGATFVKKEVTKIDSFNEYDGKKLVQEVSLYVDNANSSDTISYIVNHIANSIQIVLPTKNAKGEYIGYTSYRKLANENELASK